MKAAGSSPQPKDLPAPLGQIALWYAPPAAAGALVQVLTAYGGFGTLADLAALAGGAAMFGAAGILALVVVRYGRQTSKEARRRANQLRALGLGSLVGGYLLSPAGVASGGPDAAVGGTLVLAGVLGWALWLEREWRGASTGGRPRESDTQWRSL